MCNTRVISSFETNLFCKWGHYGYWKWCHAVRVPPDTECGKLQGEFGVLKIHLRGRLLHLKVPMSVVNFKVTRVDCQGVKRPHVTRDWGLFVKRPGCLIVWGSLDSQQKGCWLWVNARQGLLLLYSFKLLMMLWFLPITIQRYVHEFICKKMMYNVFFFFFSQNTIKSKNEPTSFYYFSFSDFG